MENLPLSLLSVEQKFAFQQFNQHLNLFVSGPGGSGKTQLIHTLRNHCKTTGREFAVCALTGCAAVLLNMNATTLHSWSGIKLAKGSKEEIALYVLKNKMAVKNWKKVQVLIVDEISMMSVKILEVIELIARRVRRNPLVFGGIQVVFTGDFFQLPPVGDVYEPSTSQFCFESPLWKQLFPLDNQSIVFTTLFRQKDPLYRSILNEIRTGSLSDANAAILQGRVGLEPTSDNDILTRLFPIKRKVEVINQQNFEKIKEKEYKQEPIVETHCTCMLDSGTPLTPEVIQMCQALPKEDIDFEVKRLLSAIPVGETVSLKKGAIVMLTVNLCLEDGLCNGSQGIVVDIIEGQRIPEKIGINQLFSIPVVRFTNGMVIRIGPHCWQSEEIPTIAVGQIPLMLAWALTIHKIQGATLERAEVDAGCSIFEYGQTYVALSRVRSLEGLYLTNFHSKRIKAHPLVKEFYKKLNETPIVDTIESSTSVATVAVAVEELDLTIPEAEVSSFRGRVPIMKVCKLP